MAYSAGVVQNVSEMLRYGWADIRPSLQRLDYDWHEFTGSNIEDLFPAMRHGKFHAVVLATNACNDDTILRAFLNHKEDVARFLNEHNGGLLILFQKRLTELDLFPSYNFLASEYDLIGKLKPETHAEGDLSIVTTSSDHVVLQYPNPIDIDDVQYHCMHNERLRSLYRGYAEPVTKGTYLSLIEDMHYAEARPLLLCSRASFPGRVISTGLILDWQAHDDLLENCVVYAVQGPPYVALIERVGWSSFDFNYLAAHLSVNGIAYHVYRQNHLEFDDRMFNLHRTMVLAPSWEFSHIARSNLPQYRDKLLTGSRVLYFGTIEEIGPAVSHIGGIRELDAFIENVVAWLRSQYHEGIWGRSFWRTFDVISAFRYLDKPVDQYWPEVLEKVYPHDKDGSYDEMFGATCALLQLYAWSLGKKSDRYKSTLTWLREALDTQPIFFERGTAIHTFNVLGEEVDLEVKRAYMSEVMARFSQTTNEFELARYVRTLDSSGFHEEAAKVAIQLCRTQGADGRWINVQETADVISILMRIQEHLPSPLHEIETAIFKGIVHLRETCDLSSYNWPEDVAATAKALVSIVDFERRISFPIDEVVTALSHDTHLSRFVTAVDASTRLNISLQTRMSTLADSLREARREAEVVHSEKVSAARLAIAVSSIAALLSAFFTVIVLYDISQGMIPTRLAYLASLAQNWSAAVFAALPLAPLVVVFAILRHYDLLPNWLKKDKNE